MKKFPLPLMIFGLMFFAGFAGFSLHQSLNENRTPKQPLQTSPTDMLLMGLPRPDFEMNDLDGNLRKVSEWDGKVLVLNFWATWCPPCKKELPVFVELQKKYADQGLQFVGLAVDTPENVQSFLRQIPLNYPNLVGEAEAMQIGNLYGNNIGALPYTVIINRSGKIVFTRKGELYRIEAQKILEPMFNK